MKIYTLTAQKLPSVVIKKTQVHSQFYFLFNQVKWMFSNFFYINKFSPKTNTVTFLYQTLMTVCLTLRSQVMRSCECQAPINPANPLKTLELEQHSVNITWDLVLSSRAWLTVWLCFYHIWNPFKELCSTFE